MADPPINTSKGRNLPRSSNTCIIKVVVQYPREASKEVHEGIQAHTFKKKCKRYCTLFGKWNYLAAKAPYKATLFVQYHTLSACYIALKNKNCLSVLILRMSS